MEKIWLNSYAPGVPQEVNDLGFSSLGELFTASCRQFASRPALGSLGHILTYQELARYARNFAGYLQQLLKLQPGARLALMLPNVPQYQVAFFGALQLGLVVVNVNPLYTVRELITQLNDAQVDTIIVLSNFAHVLQHAIPETHIKNIIITEVADLCPWLKRHTINFLVRRNLTKTPPWCLPTAVTFLEALQLGSHVALVPVEVSPSDVALLQYTGGTTGVSKAALLTHRNLLANVAQCMAWIGGVCQPGAETTITVLPLYHIFSLTVCGLFFLRLGVFQVLISNPRELPDLVKTFANYPPSLFVGVATLFNSLVNNSAFRGLDFTQLKITVAGGMAISDNIAEKWQKLTGCRVLEGYGLTEASPVVSISPLVDQPFLNTLGVPLPSTEVSIRDSNDQEVELGEEGELWVRGPQVMQGYWRRPEETAKVLSTDGWLRTGDVVIMDEQGYLYLVDRKKDLIVVAGYNVYPNEVEAVIASHAMVYEVAVVGVPSSHAGEIVKAFIVKNDEALTKEKIIAYCKERLTSYKVPKRVEFVSALPKSSVGKVLRRVLRET